jgi:hypothetical protein
MDFLIADTFTDSLARLTDEEKKAAKTTAFDLQVNPASPGMSFHKLDRARDKRFWSVRVGLDLRLIVHRSDQSLLLCYVGHHDKAYEWAERRVLQTHPSTGAAQFVEIRETVREVVVPVYGTVESPADSPIPALAGATDDQLLGYGVPSEWLEDVRHATEESLFSLADHLPAEAAEALLELATGGTPREPQAERVENPFDHPDARRRFRVMTSVEELQRALEYPWEKWTVFLHPEQRELVQRDFGGPVRVSGSAGTGKTIVALHRAVHVARAHPDARVLLTTFSDTLANALHVKLRRLLEGEPQLGERIDVQSLDAVGLRLYKAHGGRARLVSRETLAEMIYQAAAKEDGLKIGQHFLMAEWEQVVDAWQLGSWEEYRDVVRLGRKTRLPESQRRQLWSTFQRVWSALAEQGLMTLAGMLAWIAEAVRRSAKVVFDFVVVDEAQDMGVQQIRFIAVLGGDRPNALFFTGDLGQRIFQQPFSWKSLGIDHRGRCRTLRVNYRTSHQIRSQADRLLDPSLTDVDGNTEKRGDAVSVFNGPAPEINTLSDEQTEIEAVGEWITEISKAGVLPHEIGVFVRSEGQLGRAKAAVSRSGLAFTVLDEGVETASGRVSIGTMHLAKGLEFRAVAVIACDDEVIPFQERIEAVGDGADLQEVYDTERQLLYVACTRARDNLIVTGTDPASEFLGDMMLDAGKAGAS